jgi:hypothetical protein
MRRKGIAGPVFISIGEGDQLQTFLEKNPYIPPELMLVDDYSFAAYNGAGLGRIAERRDLAVKGTRQMKPPSLRPKQWLAYIRNFAKLSPIPKDFNMRSVPEGVTRLGATFGVVGNQVIYVYEDGVPGDHPDPLEVIKSFPLENGKQR